jgi:hypothetical protein
VLPNNINSNVSAVRTETGFHIVVLDRRGAAVVLCVLEDIVEMELKK